MPIVDKPTYPVTHVSNVTGFPPVTFTVEAPIGAWARGTIGCLTKTEDPGDIVRRTYQQTVVGYETSEGGRRHVQQQYPYINRHPAGTAARLICRTNFKSAQLTWKALSVEEKAPWNAKAKIKNADPNNDPETYKARSGMNLFISDYMLSL